MATIIIAAHDEAQTIGRCLDALLREARTGEFDIIVAANGCKDDTAAVARRRPSVSVIELSEAGKAAALNAAERKATRFPRIYLDADVQLDTRAVRALRDAVALPESPPGGSPDVIAAAAARRLDVSGRPWLVRAYFDINGRHPAFRRSLFGRGAIALSQDARRRFDTFPTILADDLFLDSLFADSEKAEVPEAISVIQTPWSTRDLVRRLVRVRRANRQLRQRSAARIDGGTPRKADHAGWFTRVVAPHPALAPQAVAYVAITALAELLARRDLTSSAWGRDESTRLRPTGKLPTRHAGSLNAGVAQESSHPIP